MEETGDENPGFYARKDLSMEQDRKSEVIEEIIGAEWPMFHTVNGEDRADCQENPAVFRAMRGAQFRAWTEEACESYLADLRRAQAEGRNLAREKYIRMMRTTDPEGYAAFAAELPPVSEEKARLVSAVWAHMLEETEAMREKYPAVALGGRPLRAGEEGEAGDWASIETYQTGELLTYSEETLRALLAHIEALKKQGRSLAFEIQENSVMAMGYPSMEAAEKAIAYQVIQALGGGECTTCGATLDNAMSQG